MTTKDFDAYDRVLDVWLGYHNKAAELASEYREAFDAMIATYHGRTDDLDPRQSLTSLKRAVEKLERIEEQWREASAREAGVDEAMEAFGY